MRVAIVGTGYVGLVSAVVLAHLGHRVTAVDIDESKIEQLCRGECPIFEPKLTELMDSSSNNLVFTTKYEDAYRDAEVIIIAVGTPEKADGSANMKYVFEAAGQIADLVSKSCVVVVKSTVPIGTNERIEKLFRQKLKPGVVAEVVSNPEFLSQGAAVKDMLNAERIVIGSESGWARQVMEKLYSPFKQPMVFTDRRSAEMIKYASNDFLALRISYVNEIANLCEKLGANIDDVVRGMGLDSRIGNKFLKAGIGYGGSCFPKDTKALHWLANFHETELKTVKAAIEVNDNQKLRLIKKARRYYKSFDGLTAAILGLAFKPETDDLREAPSLINIPLLIAEGVKVKVWDPCAADKFTKRVSKDAINCRTPQEALADADMCMIFTEWKQIMELKPEDFLTMNYPLILDGRNCYSPDVMRNYPLIYDSIGRETTCGLKINNF